MAGGNVERISHVLSRHGFVGKGKKFALVHYQRARISAYYKKKEILIAWEIIPGERVRRGIKPMPTKKTFELIKKE
ncbi:MAG: hypothetical protein JXA44_12915 [Methanospirillaceae archaeon]|nr:hypothetical protein [Methanospirillaceae archaeon]